MLIFVPFCWTPILFVVIYYDISAKFSFYIHVAIVIILFQ